RSGGENTPTIRRPTLSCRHQLLRIALVKLNSLIKILECLSRARSCHNLEVNQRKSVEHSVRGVPGGSCQKLKIRTAGVAHSCTRMTSLVGINRHGAAIARPPCNFIPRKT